MTVRYMWTVSNQNAYIFSIYRQTFTESGAAKRGHVVALEGLEIWSIV